MSFIYNCGKFVPVRESVSDSNWKSILFCASTGIVLFAIVRSALRDIRSEEVESSLRSLKEDIVRLQVRVERVEHLLKSVANTATDTSDLEDSGRVEKSTQVAEIKKLPLTLETTPHYKATTDISGKIIRKYNYVSN